MVLTARCGSRARGRRARFALCVSLVEIAIFCVELPALLHCSMRQPEQLQLVSLLSVGRVARKCSAGRVREWVPIIAEDAAAVRGRGIVVVKLDVDDVVRGQRRARER